MHADTTLRHLHVTLRQQGTAAKAEQEKAYLKSDLQFFGVPMAPVRALAKSIARADPPPTRVEMIALADAAFADVWFEARSVAIGVLELRRGELRAGDMKSVEAWLRAAGTWAHVDWLAIHVAGELAERHQAARARLDRWARDRDFWIRRSAMLALIPGLRRGEGDFEGFAAMAEPMLDETEFFIRKAIGWVLRETARRRPDLVEAFVAEHVARLAGLTFREATRKLPAAARTRLERRRAAAVAR